LKETNFDPLSCIATYTQQITLPTIVIHQVNRALRSWRRWRRVGVYLRAYAGLTTAIAGGNPVPGCKGRGLRVFSSVLLWARPVYAVIWAGIIGLYRAGKRAG